MTALTNSPDSAIGQLIFDPARPSDLGGSATAVGIAGDWESHTQRARKQIGWIKYADPSVRLILQLGDLRFRVDDPGSKFASRPNQEYLTALDEACHHHGIAGVLVTPGNHDDWGRMSAWWREHPMHAMPISRHVAMLPRGARFTLGGRTFLSFGGAVSVNQNQLTPGRNWWPEEAPDPASAADAARTGSADVLLLHEAPMVGIHSVTRALASSRSRRFDHLDDSRRSRQTVTDLRQAVRPAVTFHGHMDVAGSVRAQDDGRVYSLADATSNGNAGVLRLADLSWRWLDTIRPSDDTADS